MSEQPQSKGSQHEKTETWKAPKDPQKPIAYIAKHVEHCTTLYDGFLKRKDKMTSVKYPEHVHLPGVDLFDYYINLKKDRSKRRTLKLNEPIVLEPSVQSPKEEISEKSQVTQETAEAPEIKPPLIASNPFKKKRENWEDRTPVLRVIREKSEGSAIEDYQRKHTYSTFSDSEDKSRTKAINNDPHDPRPELIPLKEQPDGYYKGLIPSAIRKHRMSIRLERKV